MGDKNYFAPGRPGSPGALGIGAASGLKKKRTVHKIFGIVM